MRRMLCALVTLIVAAPSMRAANLDLARPSLTAAPALQAVNSRGVRARIQTANVIGIVYDSFTAAGLLTSTGSVPRTFMADPFTAAGSGSTLTITVARVYMVSSVAQTFSNGLLIQVQFWDGFDHTLNPVFQTAVGAVQQFTVPGPITLAANTFTPIDLTFATPLVLSGTTNGIAINYQGDNGGGPASTDNLTSLIRTTGPLAVGSFPTSGGFVGPGWGFFRNVAGQTTFNFAPTDLRSFGQTDQTLALQLTGEVTPVELESFQVE